MIKSTECEVNCEYVRNFLKEKIGPEITTYVTKDIQCKQGSSSFNQFNALLIYPNEVTIDDMVAIIAKKGFFGYILEGSGETCNSFFDTFKEKWRRNSRMSQGMVFKEKFGSKQNQIGLFVMTGQKNGVISVIESAQKAGINVNDLDFRSRTIQQLGNISIEKIPYNELNILVKIFKSTNNVFKKVKNRIEMIRKTFGEIEKFCSDEFIQNEMINRKKNDETGVGRSEIIFTLMQFATDRDFQESIINQTIKKIGITDIDDIECNRTILRNKMDTILNTLFPRQVIYLGRNVSGFQSKIPTEYISNIMGETLEYLKHGTIDLLFVLEKFFYLKEASASSNHTIHEDLCTEAVMTALQALDIWAQLKEIKYGKHEYYVLIPQLEHLPNGTAIKWTKAEKSLTLRSNKQRVHYDLLFRSRNNRSGFNREWIAETIINYINNGFHTGNLQPNRFFHIRAPTLLINQIDAPLRISMYHVIEAVVPDSVRLSRRGIYSNKWIQKMLIMPRGSRRLPSVRILASALTGSFPQGNDALIALNFTSPEIPANFQGWKGSLYEFKGTENLLESDGTYSTTGREVIAAAYVIGSGNFSEIKPLKRNFKIAQKQAYANYLEEIMSLRNVDILSVRAQRHNVPDQNIIIEINNLFKGWDIRGGKGRKLYWIGANKAKHIKSTNNYLKGLIWRISDLFGLDKFDGNNRGRVEGDHESSLIYKAIHSELHDKIETRSGSKTRARSKSETLNKDTNEIRLHYQQEFRKIINKYYINPSLDEETIDQLTRKMVTFAFKDLKEISKQINWKRLPIVNPLKTWNALRGLEFLIQIGVLPDLFHN